MKKASSDEFDAPALRTNQNINSTGAAVLKRATTTRLANCNEFGDNNHGASAARSRSKATRWTTSKQPTCSNNILHPIPIFTSPYGICFNSIFVFTGYKNSHKICGVNFASKIEMTR